MGLQARVQFNLANVYLQAGNCACSCEKETWTMLDQGMAGMDNESINE